MGDNRLEEGDTVMIHTKLKGGSNKNPHEEEYEGYLGQSEDEEEEKEDWMSQPPVLPPTLNHGENLDKQTQTTTNDIYDQMRMDLNKTKELLAQSYANQQRYPRWSMEDIQLTALDHTQNSIELMKLINFTQLYWRISSEDKRKAIRKLHRELRFLLQEQASEDNPQKLLKHLDLETKR